MKGRTTKNRKRSPKPSFGFVSLGCSKNLVDSERIAGILAAGGFPFCFDVEDADVVIVNTCSFIADAIEESTSVIGEQLARKAAGECAAVVIAGCLPARFGPACAPEGVDGWCRAGDDRGLVRIMESLAGSADAASPSGRCGPGTGTLRAETGRLRFTPPHFAYLKVTEGCDNRCSYCTIPSIRGPLRAKPLRHILSEASELAACGAREIVLIGQDTTAWRAARGGIARVIESVACVDGVEWVRLMYAHPARADDDLLRALSAGPPVLPYIDLPVQHGSDRILRAMNRRTTAKAMLGFIERLRETIPRAVIRTTVMTGFPGETAEDFDALMKFVKRAGFERLGAFSWSPEDGTPAAGMSGRVRARSAKSRLERVLELGESLRDAFHRCRRGLVEDAVVDMSVQDVSVARTWAEAPEVDPVIAIRRGLETGSVHKVEILGESGPDMEGRVREDRG